MALQVVNQPGAPQGVARRVNRNFTDNFVTVRGYNSAQQIILGTTIDDVETTVSLETYERMENDPTITKSKRIIITNVLTDEMQFAPSANENDVSVSEWANYTEIFDFSKRVITGLDRPFRGSLAQLLGNGVRYGHGISEIEWELRLDAPEGKRPDNVGTKKPEAKAQNRFTSAMMRLGVRPKSAFASMLSSVGLYRAEDTPIPAENPLVAQRRNEKQLRLMPKSIKVKPRGSVSFVVDDYFDILGFLPRNRKTIKSNLQWNEIVDPRKFMWLTLNEQDEDPRGRSFYRPVYNWYNLKTQMPGEILRFIIEEIVPKAVGTLPEQPAPYEPEVDEYGDGVFVDATGTVVPEGTPGATPKMIDVVRSFARQIENFRSGSGAILPFGAKLEPYRKSGDTDAKIFNGIISIIETQMEHGMLLQSLAQSEGEHQARSAASVHKELLEAMTFWIRWFISVMVLRRLLQTAVEFNYGPAFVKYLPFVSLGDFVRRDWARDLEIIAKAYFYGFIDDTQRAELMAWLNLPEPGPSRQELGLEATAQSDINGDPAMPNKQRPDKQAGTKNRNDGNGTEKKNDKNKTTRRGTLYALGYHGKRFVGRAGNLFSGH